MPPSAARVLLISVVFAGSNSMAQVPAIFTQPAGPIRQANATLNAMGLPKGGAATSVWFEWGPDGNYGLTSPPISIGSGTTVVRVTQAILGLDRGAAYHYRAVASNSFGIAYGAEAVLTTGMKIQNWGSYGNGLPMVPIGLTNMVAVASGHGHCLALRDDGTVAAWFAGFPNFVATDYGQAIVPIGLSNVLAVAGGYSHSLAVKEDGTVVAWGKYFNGATVSIPASVTNVIAVAGGDSHSIALRANGTVVAWGDNSSGQTSIPLNLTNVVAITAGAGHNIALKADGKCVGWGSDFGGSPTPPVTLSNVVAVSSEVWHQLALKTDGTVSAWGYNGYGQTSVPVGLADVLSISAGWMQSTALKKDGTLVIWGYPPAVSSLPSGLSNVVAVSSGDYHSTGLAPVNLPPVTFPAKTFAEINHDAVIPFDTWDPNGDPMTLTITSLPDTGALYQYTPTGRGAPISAANTAISNSTRVIFAPDLGSSGAPLTTFTFTAADGTDVSSNQVATVTIIPRPIIDSIIYERNPARATVSFEGVTNVPYRLWAKTSPQLTSFTLVGNPTQSVTTGKFFCTDMAVTNYPARFYYISTQ